MTISVQHCTALVESDVPRTLCFRRPLYAPQIHDSNSLLLTYIRFETIFLFVVVLLSSYYIHSFIVPLCPSLEITLLFHSLPKRAAHQYTPPTIRFYNQYYCILYLSHEDEDKAVSILTYAISHHSSGLASVGSDRYKHPRFLLDRTQERWIQAAMDTLNCTVIQSAYMKYY